MRGYSLICRPMEATGKLSYDDTAIYLKLVFQDRRPIEEFCHELSMVFKDAGFEVRPLFTSQNFGMDATAFGTHGKKGKTGLSKEDYLKKQKNSCLPLYGLILKHLKKVKEDYGRNIMRQICPENEKALYYYPAYFKRLERLGRIEKSKKVGNCQFYKLKEVAKNVNK